MQDSGRPLDAEAFLRQQRRQFPAIGAYIAAFTLWWHERQSGGAPGLSEVLDQLPSWLKRELRVQITDEGMWCA